MRGSINRTWNRTVRRRREVENKGSLRSSFAGNLGTTRLPISVMKVLLSRCSIRFVATRHDATRDYANLLTCFYTSSFYGETHRLSKARNLLAASEQYTWISRWRFQRSFEWIVASHGVVSGGWSTSKTARKRRAKGKSGAAVPRVCS